LSALGVFLDVFGTALLFLLGGFPGGDEVIVLAPGAVSDFEDHRAEATARPSDCAELLRIAVLLVDNISLIEDLLRFLQANPVFLPDGTALLAVIPEPQHI